MLAWCAAASLKADLGLICVLAAMKWVLQSGESMLVVMVCKM